jgi:hypothetical protein
VLDTYTTDVETVKAPGKGGGEGRGQWERKGFQPVFQPNTPKDPKDPKASGSLQGSGPSSSAAAAAGGAVPRPPPQWAANWNLTESTAIQPRSDDYFGEWLRE